MWVGSSLECTSDGNTLEEVRAAGYNMSCTFIPLENNLVAFYQNIEVIIYRDINILAIVYIQVKKEITIPAGSDLLLRCSDIGKYKIEGR